MSWITSSILAATAFCLLPCASDAKTQAESGRRPTPIIRLITIGSAYSVEANGCQTRSSRFRVSTVQPVHRTQAREGQILGGVQFRTKERTGRAGWRNVGFSADGRGIEFELFAEGGGTSQLVPGEGAKCLAPSVARIEIDIDTQVADWKPDWAESEPQHRPGKN